MFPTWTIPPQHAETVGARKARKAREADGRRTGSAASSSSGSVPDVKYEGDSDGATRKTFFPWGSTKKSREIQEISALPLLKTTQASQDSAQQTSPVTPHTSSFQPERFAPQRSPISSPSSGPPVTLPTPPLSPRLAHTLRDTVDLARSGVDRITSQISTSSYTPSTAYPDRMTSQNPHVSFSTSPISPDRTAFSVRSIFSNSPGYDNAMGEESYPDSRHHRNAQGEPVESELHSPSGLGDRGGKSSFARALAKMENASARIIAARLDENWASLDDDESYQEIAFEKRLWALTAYQRLTHNKQLQTPAHEILCGSLPGDQRRILHLHGSLADGWVLATSYPAATVYTTSSTTNFTAPTSHTAPLNHHSLYIPSLSAAMPFPDGYFDAIVSRSLSTILHNDQWTQSFLDFKRILKPGGQIEILSVDAHLSNEGPKLSSWIDSHIVSKLSSQGISTLPSDTLLETMETVSLENIRRARVALPEGLCSSRPRTSSAHPPPAPDMADSIKMMAHLGRHFYQELYSKTTDFRLADDWFWSCRDIQHECERHQTKIMLTIACAQKPAGSSLDDTCNDI